MKRTVSLPNKYRTFPLKATDRLNPVPYSEESLYISQGRSKRAQLGQTVRPFDGLFVSPDDGVTAIRYQIDGGSWVDISEGDYPDLITSAQAVEFTPTEFATKVIFTIEFTSTIIVTRDVDILCDVVAGVDKVVERDTNLCPFFDALFAIDGDNLSDAQYKIDNGSKTAIPASFGSDLAVRVRAFTISFSSAGTKRCTLYLTDASSGSGEFSDSLAIRVA